MFWRSFLLVAFGLFVSVTAAEAQCSSYTNISNGSTADATVVMHNFGCAALTSGATLTSVTLTSASHQAATIADTGSGPLGIMSSIAAGGITGPGLYSYGSQLGFGVNGTINFVTGTGGNTLSATIGQNGNLTIYGSGTTCVIGSGTGTTSCTSDERLKRDIQPISGAEALMKLARVQGVTYNWADPSKSQERQVGVIAQQVQQAFPQLVGSVETTFEGKKEPYLTVNYAGLVAPLISAVNDLNQHMTILQAENSRLVAETKKLRVRNDREITQLRLEISHLQHEMNVQTASR